MDKLTDSILTIAVAIVGLATLAVIVSRNAKTSEVIRSAGDAFSGSILAAVAPVTGGAGNLSGRFGV